MKCFCKSECVYECVGLSWYLLCLGLPLLVLSLFPLCDMSELMECHFLCCFVVKVTACMRTHLCLGVAWWGLILHREISSFLFILLAIYVDLIFTLNQNENNK